MSLSPSDIARTVELNPSNGEDAEGGRHPFAALGAPSRPDGERRRGVVENRLTHRLRFVSHAESNSGMRLRLADAQRQPFGGGAVGWLSLSTIMRHRYSSRPKTALPSTKALRISASAPSRFPLSTCRRVSTDPRRCRRDRATIAWARCARRQSDPAAFHAAAGKVTVRIGERQALAIQSIRIKLVTPTGTRLPQQDIDYTTIITLSS